MATRYIPLKYAAESSTNMKRLALGLAGTLTLVFGANAVRENLVESKTGMTIDTCLETEAANLMSQFETIEARDKEWGNITFKCAQSYGLPEDVAIDIDDSKSDISRYVRVLSPTGE